MSFSSFHLVLSFYIVDFCIDFSVVDIIIVVAPLFATLIRHILFSMLIWFHVN